MPAAASAAIRKGDGMFYRVVYHVLLVALAFSFAWVLTLVAKSNTSIWVMAPVGLAWIFFPTEWLAEKISGQPRVDHGGGKATRPRDDVHPRSRRLRSWPRA